MVKIPAETPANSDQYVPAPGALRIWKRAGAASRKMAEIDNGGDFIKSGKQYDAADLGYGSGRSVILYVEGIASSDRMGDQRIAVEVQPDPGKPFACRDIVRCTLLKAELVPDWNHDRAIDERDFKRATFKNPYRFWINDDKDDGDVAAGDSDVPGQNNGNAADAAVNGRCDLLDFFPVWANIHSTMKLLPDDYNCSYVLRQADAAVNFFHSDLIREKAGNFLIEESQSYGSSLDKPAYLVSVVNIPDGGIDMTAGGADLLGAIHANPDKGVLILEGKASTTSPLILEIRKDGPAGTLLYETQLPLSLSGVEEMYRTVNLRNMTNPGQLPPPSNNSAALSNGKNLVFVHGYQSSGGATWSTAWLSEMFKRSYRSGSRAIFHGVTWRSNEGDSMDYQKNVTNAFGAAPVLKDYVAGLNGDVIVAAHSLGNIVVSSAIVDHDMSVAKFMLCNAAVASEAFDATLAQDVNLINPWWSDYSTRTWAANWHQLFTGTGDSRANLTWRDRFRRVVARTEVWNFYSEGDEVFDLATSPGLFTGAIGVNINWWFFVPVSVNVNVNFGRYSWQKQEMFKGTRYSDGWSSFGGTAEAGWGYESTLTHTTHEGENAWELVPIYTNAAGANAATDESIRSNPVFRHSPDWLIRSNTLSQGQVNFMLGMGIPALTPSAGRTQIKTSLVPAGRQMNLNDVDFMPNGWPTAGHSGQDANLWLHNDIKAVGYLYNHKLFDKVIDGGNLK